MKPFGGSDFVEGAMEDDFTIIKGKAYVFKMEDNAELAENYRFKLMEQDKIAKQVSHDIQAWKDPFNRWPIATHRIPGYGVSP